MVLSKRLQAVANLVTKGLKVADIGTDHGYIPIYLSDFSPKVLAMDVKIGPLDRAKENITKVGKEAEIELRLSDGLKELKPEEVECVILAGMGGNLMIDILSAGEAVTHTLKEMVLQPQSDIMRVRAFICESGWHIEEEDIVLDGGKYYPMMRIVKGKVKPYTNVELQYGPLLLQSKNPIMQQFLEREKKNSEDIYKDLGKSPRELKVRTLLEKQIESIDCELERMNRDANL